MKRIKYGKNRNKTIYVPEDREKDWKNVVDFADNSGEGIGILLLDAWKEKNKNVK